ncbi:MAG TPA: UxaA family hydrolase [Deltaproteobacteria bacterium]|nr:UxaA family hydrolase [Deltaproteobacteria bacterium]
MKHDILLIDAKDNVGVALADIAKGGRAGISAGGEVEAADDIPMSHKIALKDIRAGEPVIKYGEEIGRAREDIPRGGWVHVHNLEIGEG